MSTKKDNFNRAALTEIWAVKIMNKDLYEEEFIKDYYFYSPTSWNRNRSESEEDYLERIQDQEDWLESFDD